MLFSNFHFFHFSKFPVTIVKNLTEKLSPFIINFKGFYEALLRHKYF